MSRMTTVNETESLLSFAKTAGAWFVANPKGATFGGTGPGELLALRWGMGGDCVLVVKLDADFEPINFQQAARAVKS